MRQERTVYKASSKLNTVLGPLTRMVAQHSVISPRRWSHMESMLAGGCGACHGSSSTSKALTLIGYFLHQATDAVFGIGNVSDCAGGVGFRPQSI